MATQDMITAQDFCIHHNVEIIQTEEEICVPMHQLPQLEKMVRLYYEMDINMEGIETINHLLNRMNEMQQEIVKLQNRLGVYEEE